jgi:hypothetical protein
MSSRAWWLSAALFLAAPAMSLPPDPMRVITDMERILISDSGDHETLVLWFSPEFWRFAGMTTAADRITAMMAPYHLIIVVDMHRLSGSPTFTTADALRSSVTLEDAGGKLMRPLAADALPQAVSKQINDLYPALKSLFGQFGEHLQIIAFRTADESGRRFADPTKDGSLTVHVGELTLRYELPLASLLPPMVDPKTHASFPGNYRFNPFTGDPLTPAAADK